VATIISEEIAPEISPKVSMVLFIYVSCGCKPLYVKVGALAHHTAAAGAFVVTLSNDFALRSEKSFV
jgi:hypothetical protein